MPKYSAGDKVTIVLDNAHAHDLNGDFFASFREKQIISHIPAPEPIVWWTNVNIGEYSQYNHPSKNKADLHKWDNRLALIKTTFNPATKQVESEVV